MHAYDPAGFASAPSPPPSPPCARIFHSAIALLAGKFFSIGSAALAEGLSPRLRAFADGGLRARRLCSLPSPPRSPLFPSLLHKAALCPAASAYCRLLDLTSSKGEGGANERRQSEMLQWQAQLACLSFSSSLSRSLFLSLVCQLMPDSNSKREALAAGLQDASNAERGNVGERKSRARRV